MSQLPPLLLLGTPQDEIMREFAHLMRGVEWCGPSAEEALVNLERRVPGLTQTLPRDLHGLHTPTAAKKVLPCWLKLMVTKGGIETACKQATLEQ